MKLSVVFFVVLVASVCANDEDEQRKRMVEIGKKCLKEAGTTMDELKTCHEQKKKCPKMNCFETCTLREDNFINKDGRVNAKVRDEVAANLAAHGHKKTAEAMKKCFQDSKKKLIFCDIGHEMLNCMDAAPHD